MLNFDEFLNESFLPNHLQDELNRKETFEESVNNHIHDIIMQEFNISEKAFDLYDTMIEKFNKFFINLKQEGEIQKDLNLHESENKRKQLCAEFIYDKYFKNNFEL